MKELTNKDLANLLKNDVIGFNNYREKFPNQKIDFTKLDDCINFKYSSLDDAIFLKEKEESDKKELFEAIVFFLIIIGIIAVVIGIHSSF